MKNPQQIHEKSTVDYPVPVPVPAYRVIATVAIFFETSSTFETIVDSMVNFLEKSRLLV
jgi:hypothetical protein